MENARFDFKTFTESDWSAFSGAEPFKDGSEPMIAEVPDSDACIVISGGGIQVLFGNDSYGDLKLRTLPKDFLKAVANLLPVRLDPTALRALGFIVYE